MTTRSKIKEPETINPTIYDIDYFLKYCCGAAEFSESQADKLPRRLQRCIEVANFKRGQHILDIGCGRGEIAYYAAKMGCSVTAVDYSKDAITITRKLISRLPYKVRREVNTLRIDAKELDYPEESFDQIMMTDVIEHLQPWEVDIVIDKCYQFLKPGGRLVINTSPNVWFVKFSYPIIQIFKTILNFKNPGKFIECYRELHVFEQSPLTLRKILKKFKTTIWGENFTQASWFNSIPLLNLFAASLFAVAIKAPKENMARKQNLVVLANPFVSSKGLAGGDLFYIELSHYLKKSYDIYVVLPKFAKIHWKNTRVNLIFLKPNIFDQSEKRIFIFFAYLIRSFQTYGLLKQFPPKTIVCSSSDFFPDVLPIFARKMAKNDVFWVARFYHLIKANKNKGVNRIFNFVSFLFQRLSVYLAIKKADLILIDNKETARFFRQKGVKSDKLLLIGGGIHINELKKYRNNCNKIYDAVFAGRLDYTKGVFDLPNIWSQVVKVTPSAKLSIVGTATTQNQKRLQKIIKENKIAKNVELFGFLPHEGKKTIFDIFAKSKIFLSLTLEGGRDFTLIEAMACGLPVVAYEQPFLKEGTINNGFLLTKKNDRNKVAKLIVLLLQDQKARTLLAKMATLEVEKFDWKYTYNALFNSLSKLTRIKV